MVAYAVVLFRDRARFIQPRRGMPLILLRQLIVRVPWETQILEPISPTNSVFDFRALIRTDKTQLTLDYAQV